MLIEVCSSIDVCEVAIMPTTPDYEIDNKRVFSSAYMIDSVFDFRKGNSI